MSGPAQPANPPLRWKRLLVFAVVVGAILLAVAWAPVALQIYESYRERKAAEPRPIIATDAQQAAIVRAIVTMEHSPLRVPPPPAPPPGSDQTTPSLPETDPVEQLPTGLLDRTLSLRSCDPPRPGSAIRCDMGGHMSEEIERADRESLFSITWRRELVAASLTPTRLADPQVGGVVLVAGESDAIGRLAGFSRAVLSRDGRAALVYFEAHGHSLGASCIVYNVMHTSTGWVVHEQEWYCVG